MQQFVAQLLLLGLSCLGSGGSAFLFQRLRPITLQQQAAAYSNYYDNFTSQAHGGHLGRPPTPSQSQQQQTIGEPQPRQHQQEPELGPLAAVSHDESSGGECPSECHCNKAAQIADCSNRRLERVPQNFPKDIKRIRLERNNISELGPYSFQGLKRLQRIDLSNNNLLKLDPLAFSGGLQSLNSLILYSNKISQLPANLFAELHQLQLLLLNANSLQCIHKELFQPLANLNLLSLYDNQIESLVNGTFDGLKSIKTIHLGKNPLQCDCNLRWLADYLELNPIETSEAKCEGPSRIGSRKLKEVNKQKFRCEGQEQARGQQLAAACQQQQQGPSGEPSGECPAGCLCDGQTIDCSRVSESRTQAAGLGMSAQFELPDIPDDIPVYVTRMRINDQRIKRIRQTGLFRRLANAQRLDLGNNKIVDIEDNYIGGAPAAKPERVVFVLLENEQCSSSANAKQSQSGSKVDLGNLEDACQQAPKVNGPAYDSPCYNGGSCVSSSAQLPAPANSTYSCLCPPGFAGPLCEINLDDCAEHQCQNGAACVDGVNSYRCVCRDPTTSGEFCEQLQPSAGANSLAAPIALPMIAAVASSSAAAATLSSSSSSSSSNSLQLDPSSPPTSSAPASLISTRSAVDSALLPIGSQEPSQPLCRRVTVRKHYYDGNGCHSVRVLKLSECLGACGGLRQGDRDWGSPTPGCCQPAKVKRRRVRMQCSDGASYVKTVELIKKCACSANSSGSCPRLMDQQQLAAYNTSQEDQLLQITRLDAVDAA